MASLPNLNSVDSRAFIPPVLSQPPFNITPTGCRLTSKTSGNKTVFTYALTWEVDNSEDERVVLSVQNSLTSCSNGSNSTPDQPELPVCHKSKSNANNGTVLVLCDGPCGNVYPSDQLNTLGRCGHYLCKLCYGLIINTDGSFGCSAFSCTFQSVFAFLSEEYAKKAYKDHIQTRILKKEPLQLFESTAARTSRSDSVPVLCEIRRCFSNISLERCDAATTKMRSNVLVRLLIVEPNGNGKINKSKVKREYPSQVSLKEALYEMLDYKENLLGKPHECPIRLFFLPVSSGAGIRPVKHREYETALLEQFPVKNSMVHFVLDSANYIRI